MDKNIVKLLFEMMVFSCYIVNLICMFNTKPMVLFIGNVGSWLILVCICLFLWFFDKE